MFEKFECNAYVWLSTILFPMRDIKYSYLYNNKKTEHLVYHYIIKDSLKLSKTDFNIISNIIVSTQLLENINIDIINYDNINNLILLNIFHWIRKIKLDYWISILLMLSYDIFINLSDKKFIENKIKNFKIFLN